MGRPIGVEKKKEVLALLAEGHTCSEVGRRAGVDRHTVKKIADEEAERVAAEEAAAVAAKAAGDAARVAADFERLPASAISKAQVGKLV